MKIDPNNFDPDGADRPLRYLDRIKSYYMALNYGAPYRWAQFDDVPFTPLAKPLSASKIGLVTTAAPYQSDKGDQSVGATYNGTAKFFQVYSRPTDQNPDLRISHISYDRAHTKSQDQRSYFPLAALRQLASEGYIGGLAARFHGLPTNRSVRTTVDVDCAELLARCLADGVDAVVLVPNCPVCHQSVSLAARVLEQAGIPTIIMGCAKDIVEHVGVPRVLFNNFPLGNSTGLPDDPTVQLDIARMAVDVLNDATVLRTTVQSPYRWDGVRNWQKDYSNAALLSGEGIARRRAEFDRVKSEA